MSHVVRKHLRLEIDAYDAAIRTFIPGYEEALTKAASEIAGVRPTLVLDLGTGTGALAEALLAHDRVEAVEALDIDPEMLAQARLRLTRFGTRARVRRGSFEAPLPRCDAVGTSLALHHVPTMARKRRLYARITGRSAPAASSLTPTWPSVRIRWRARRRTVDGSPIWGRAVLMNSGPMHTSTHGRRRTPTFQSTTNSRRCATPHSRRNVSGRIPHTRSWSDARPEARSTGIAMPHRMASVPRWPLTPLYVKTRVQAAWMSSWRARKSVMTRW